MEPGAPAPYRRPAIMVADMTNVIPLPRPRGENDAFSTSLRAHDQPAADQGRGHWLFGVLFLGSLTVHGLVLAALMRDPEPMPSLGIPAITVELVLGADAPAGTSVVPAQAEMDVSVTPERTDIGPPEPDATKEPRTAEATRDPLIEEESDTKSIPVPAEATPERSSPVSDTPLPEPAIAPRRAKQVEKTTAPQKKADQAKAKRQNERSARASIASAASGVGRGSSSADADYAARVAAHLARHKRFPPEAQSRGISGSAMVRFNIDGGGRVISVRLVRGTGLASLDQEAQDMVRRASPVPAPPSRQATSFTLPISFQVR